MTVGTFVTLGERDGGSAVQRASDAEASPQLSGGVRSGWRCRGGQEGRQGWLRLDGRNGRRLRCRPSASDRAPQVDPEKPAGALGDGLPTAVRLVDAKLPVGVDSRAARVSLADDRAAPWSAEAGQ